MTQAGATNLASHPRRAKALELMLAGRTDREIATELSVDPSTVWRWRTDPSFAAELDREQRERFSLVGERLSALVHRAVDTLGELLSDPSTPPMLRIRTAESILDRSGWSGGASDRRVQALVKAETEAFLRHLVEKVDDATLDKLQEALKEPWPEPEEPSKTEARPRPRIVVEYPSEDS